MIPPHPKLPAKIGKIRRHLFARLILILLFLSGLLTAMVLTIQYVENQNQIVHSAREHVILVTRNAAKEIETFMRQAMERAQGIAVQLSSGTLKPAEFSEILREEILSNPDYYGSTITYKPYGFQRNKRLYSFYIYRSHDGLKQVQLENEYDYSTAKCEWYSTAMQRGSRWSKPYFDDAGKTLMVTYSALFYSPRDKDRREGPLGVVTLDISIHGIKDILMSLDLGPSGYPALTTRNGIYLYHPNMDYVTSQKTIFDVAKETGDKKRRIVGEKAKSGQGGIIDHVSVTTQKESWLVFESIPSTGWSLQDTFIKDAIDLDPEAQRKKMTQILNSLLISMLAVCCLLFFTHFGKHYPWIPVALILFFILSAIGFLWNFSLRFPPPEKNKGVEISDRPTLNRVQERYAHHCRENHLQQPLFIPTGILIDTIRFDSPNDIGASGYVWQKYRLGKHDHIPRGIIFAQSDNREIVELMRSRKLDWEVVCWRFNITIRSRINYSGYPIDHGLIRIKLLHRGLNESVILVPDLSSYTLATPSLLPQLDEGTFLPGWTLERSYFELEKQNRNIRYGVIDTISKDNLPALLLRIQIQRNFINAFISNLTPLILVSLLLFTILCIAKSILIGRFIATCVAMFLVIVFSHIDTRKAIAIQDVFYLEYFYFLFYALLFFVVLNAIKIRAAKPGSFFSYRDNLISKLLYWPLLSGILYIVTLISFC